jgi:LysM repeat protein
VRPQVQASSQRPAPAIPVPAPAAASAKPAPPAAAKPAAASAPAAAKPALQPTPAELALPISQHTVAQGETLYSIARRYGVSVDQVRSWNQLPDNTIKIPYRDRIVGIGLRRQTGLWPTYSAIHTQAIGRTEMHKN